MLDGPWMRRCFLAAPLCLLACVPESIFDQPLPEPEEETDEGGFAPERPRFLEPDDGTLTITADHAETIELRVQFFVPGLTYLFLDGKNFGGLPSGTREGEYDGGFVRLFFGGSLTAGVHALNLYTPGDPEGELSPPVAIEVRPSDELVPEVTFEDAPFAQALELGQQGIGEGGQLFWIEPEADGRQLAWMSSDAGGTWLEQEVRRVRLADYVARPGEAARASVHVGSQGAPWRIAWSAGASGQRFRHAELELTDSNSELIGTETSVDGLPFVVGESRRLGAPRIAGDFVVLPYEALRDTEQPMPGDQGIAYAPWPQGDALASEWRRLASSPVTDLDLLAPFVDLRGPEPEDDDLALCFDGVQVRRISGEQSLNVINFPDPPPTGLDPLDVQAQYIVTVAGALGSRTTFVAAGSESVINFEAVLAERGESQRLVGVPLPAQSLSGPPAATTWAGRTVFFLPYTDDDLHIVVSDGARGRSYALPHQCDQIAVGRPRLGGGENFAGDHTDVVSLACLRDGELRLGELRPETP